MPFGLKAVEAGNHRDLVLATTSRYRDEGC